jgi:hypothetical protein
MRQDTHIMLTRTQLLQAVVLAGLRINSTSPLGDLAKTEAPRAPDSELDALTRVGWLEAGHLTPAARNIMQALCEPRVRVRLMLGTRDRLTAIEGYSALGLYAGKLVSFLADKEHDEYRLRPELSPYDLVKTLSAQILNGPLDDSVSFHAAPDLVEFVTLLAILDLHLHTQLKAMLDRQRDPQTQMTVQSLREILVEGVTARDLGWAVTAFACIFPFLDYDLDADKIAMGLAGLETKGLVSAIENHRYALTEQLLDLCGPLLPIVSYGAMHLEQRDNAGAMHANYLAFIRGAMTVLVAEPVVNQEGQRVMALDCVDAVRLADILFDLGLPDMNLMLSTQETRSVQERRVCPSCGAERIPNRQFCTQCGAAFESDEKQREKAPTPTDVEVTCPICKAPVKPGRKFCSACGAPLTTPLEKAGVQ